MESEKNGSVWSLLFILVLCINSLNSIAVYMLNPIMSEFIVTKGIAFEYTGMISGLLSWIALFFTPFAGMASDRVNKKKMLLASYTLFTLCMFLYLRADNLFLMFGVRFLHGVAFAVTSTLSLAFASDFVAPDRIAEGLAYLSLGQLIGSMFGPQIGSTIYDLASGNAVFLFAGIASLISVLIILILPYKPRETEKKRFVRVRFRDLYAAELTVYMILIGIFSFGNGIISYYLKSMGTQRSIPNIALFFTLNSLAMLLFKPFSSRLHDRKGIGYILYPAFLINAAAMVILARAYTLIPVLAASVLKALGQGCGSPAIQAESVKMLGRKRAGVAVSTCLIGMNIGQALGPMVGVQIISAYGYAAVFYSTAVLLVIAEVIYIIYHSYMKKHPLPAAE